MPYILITEAPILARNDPAISGRSQWVDADSLKSSFIAAFGDDSVGTTDTPRYLTPWVSTSLAQTLPIQWDSPRTGSLRNLYIKQNVPGGGTNRIVYTIRINGVVSGLSVSLPANSTGGSNLVDSVAVNAGDCIDMEITKPDGDVAASPRDVVATLEFT